jgi:hypothetical protein
MMPTSGGRCQGYSDRALYTEQTSPYGALLRIAPTSDLEAASG